MSREPEDVSQTDPAEADAWLLRYDRFDPAREGLREALCTLGNGYFATRGAAPEAVADGTHYPGTYVAGVYNRLSTLVVGRTVVNESVVNVPNWLALTFRIDGSAWFDLDDVDILEYSQDLDLRQGILDQNPPGPRLHGASHAGQAAPTSSVWPTRMSRVSRR